jgi:hypothetical protein
VPRQQTHEGDIAVDERSPTDDPLVHDSPRQTTPDDPRRIGDDGTIIGDDDTVVSTPPPRPSEVGAAPPWIEARPARRGHTWGQALILLAGVTSLVFGVGAVALGGLAGPVTAPVVDVFSFTHTPLLGLIEIAVGLVLVLTALVPGGRWIAGPVGVGLVVAGALVITELDWIRTELAAERRFGAVPIIVGTVTYLGAMVPTKRRTPAVH